MSVVFQFSYCSDDLVIMNNSLLVTFFYFFSESKVFPQKAGAHSYFSFMVDLPTAVSGKLLHGLIYGRIFPLNMRRHPMFTDMFIRKPILASQKRQSLHLCLNILQSQSSSKLFLQALQKYVPKLTIRFLILMSYILRFPKILMLTSRFSTGKLRGLARTLTVHTAMFDLISLSPKKLSVFTCFSRQKSFLFSLSQLVELSHKAFFLFFC